MKKNAKIIYGFVIVLFVIASCCKKNNSTPPNLLKGKIKRIQEKLVVPNKNYYYDLHFFYDSTDGTLQKITLGNKVYIEISKKTSNYFILDYDVSVRDSTTTPNHVKIKAYLNNDGYINRLVFIDSSLTDIQELMNIYSKNDYPDSIREFIGESKHYDFQFLNGNIVQSFHFYNLFLSGDNTIQLNYFYSNNVSYNIIPSQMSSVFLYSVGFSTRTTEPLFLLGLNGFLPFKSNRNLIDSMRSVGSTSITTKFEYTSNSYNEITQMKKYNTVTNETFDVEYY